MEFKPLYLSVLLLIIVGILIPSLIGGFVDVEGQDDPTGVAGFLYEKIDKGFFNVDNEKGDNTILPNLNPFDLLGDDIKNLLLKWVKAYSIIPAPVRITSMIFISIGFFYTFVMIVKDLVPFT